MKKSRTLISLLLISFLILGIFAQGFVIADDDDSSSDSDDDDSNSGTDEDNEDEDENNGTEEEDEDDDLREKFRTETRTSEDGEKTRTRTFNRTINEDGTITITKIETITRGNETRTKIKTKTFTIDGEHEFEIETEFEFENDKNESRLRIKDKNRTIILPEEALERMREKLEARNITNITLRERNDSDRNLPRVLYIIETNENGRFLGIFKMRLRANAEVDAETGEVKTNFPWWAIFVAREESIRDSMNETNTNSTNNESESNDSLGLTIPDEDGNSSPIFDENGSEILA